MAHQANGHNYQFYGVGKKKAGRRSNGARPRKMYAYADKDQKGTPMETMIKAQYATLDDQINARNPSGPGSFAQNDATGKLGTHWKNIARRMTTGGAIARHIQKHGGSVGQARNKLVGISWFVKYGADPKNR